MAALVLAWGVSGICQAAPLEPSTVSAHAKWLIHVDFDGMRESKVVQHIHKELMKHEKFQKCLEKVKDMTGMDVEKDLHGLTVYGDSFKPHEGVMIVYAHADRSKLVDLMKKAPATRPRKKGI